MNQYDLIITVINVFFIYALIPQILKNFREKKDNVSMQTSVINSVGTYLICIIYFILNLYLSSAITFIAATLWGVISIQGIKYKKKK